MQTTAHQSLPTQNPVYGFWGAMDNIGQPAAAAWEIAFQQISAETVASAEAVQAFLDSRFGRHFADEVANHLVRQVSLEAAVRASINTHLSWTIDHRTARQHGIPSGLSYLHGWLGCFENELDAAA